MSFWKKILGGLTSNIPIVGGIVSGLVENSSAKKNANAVSNAANTAASQFNTLAAPYLEQTAYALPKMRQMVSQWGAKVGQESPLIKASHVKSETAIGRDTNRSLAASARMWTATGNSGRGRGEQLRISRMGDEAKSNENLAYGNAQEAYKDQNASRYMAGLSSIANSGVLGTSLATNAIGTTQQAANTAAGLKSAGTNALWGDIAAGAGTVYGEWQAEQQAKRDAELMKIIYGQ